LSISNVDQQLVDEIKSLMAGVLGNSTLVKSEIMGDLPTDLVDDFIATYCTDGDNRGLEIPVYFSFPTTPPKTAFLLAQYKGSVEDEDSSSLGGIQGSVQNKHEGPVIHEKVAFTYYQDKHSLIGITQNKIYSINSIPQFAIQNIKFDGNTISILDVNDAIGSMFDGIKTTDVYYSEYLDDKKADILPIGINTSEGVTIDFIASNTNTIRCLSALFVYIQIYLRHTITETYNVYDPKIEVSGMDAIENLQNQGDLSQQLYYRRLTITYKVTQVISQSMAEKIGILKEPEINVE
jgi:hypothetical protein